MWRCQSQVHCVCFFRPTPTYWSYKSNIKRHLNQMCLVVCMFVLTVITKCVQSTEAALRHDQWGVLVLIFRTTVYWSVSTLATLLSEVPHRVLALHKCWTKKRHLLRDWENRGWGPLILLVRWSSSNPYIALNAYGTMLPCLSIMYELWSLKSKKLATSGDMVEGARSQAALSISADEGADLVLGSRLSTCKEGDGDKWTICWP